MAFSKAPCYTISRKQKNVAKDQRNFMYPQQTSSYPSPSIFTMSSLPPLCQACKSPVTTGLGQVTILLPQSLFPKQPCSPTLSGLLLSIASSPFHLASLSLGVVDVERATVLSTARKSTGHDTSLSVEPRLKQQRGPSGRKRKRLQKVCVCAPLPAEFSRWSAME
jgi:hypothetical protein